MPDSANSAGTLERLVSAAATLLRPLEDVLTPQDIRALITVDLGVRVPAGVLEGSSVAPALTAVATAAAKLPDEITALIAALNQEQPDAAVQQAAKVLTLVKSTVDSLGKIGPELQKLGSSIPGVTSAQLQKFAQDLPARLLEILTIRYLNEYLLRKEWLLLLGLVEQQQIPVDPQDTTKGLFVREELHLERFFQLLQSPAAYAKTLYGWGDAIFQAQKLLERIRDVLLLTDLPATVTPAAGTTPATLEYSLFTLRQRDHGLELQLKVPIAQGFDFPFVIAENFTVDVSSSAEFEAGLRIAIQPPFQVTLLPVTSTLNGQVQAQMTGQNADTSQPHVLLGATGGSRLEAMQVALGVTLSAGATTSGSAHGEFGIEAGITGGKVVIDTTGGDSFLGSILPAGKLEAPVDMAMTWTPSGGLQFKGGAGVEITLPINLTLGPVQLQTLHVATRLDSSTSGMPIEISGDFHGQLGPVDVVVSRMGVEAQLSLPRGGGNLGPMDFGLGFKPPNGLGLTVDGEAVVGGGFISFDGATAQYSGVLELQIAEKISVKAIAILTTRLPGGASGFSLVALIFAEGFTPIQLGLGFALTGVGGLIAINRTFSESVLQAGLKNHTLDGVLFPADPVRNAPQIISNLNKIFPPAQGHHLFGPVVQISWGTPALVTANLALILEIGARLRLLILAQIAAALPSRDNALLLLQMDAVGIIDFDQGTASIDASLHESRLLNKFVLTGDMAMRMAWKGTRNFALAVGGLHPAFNPPPGFPKLERIAINLSSGDNPRIRCDAYFAITSNTEQFGAHAELTASAAGFTIHGEIGYDVLFQLDPFLFVADFQAQVQLMRGSTNLFKVKVEGELAGPRPLHVKAKATFEILWWDVSVSIDRTLISGDEPPSLPPVDVLPLLRTALADPGNWTGQLPAGLRPVVTLRPSAGAPGVIPVHPLGTLTAKQGVVPLDLTISRFGETTPSGARQFSITSVTLGTTNETPQTVTDFFAPAQFFDMSDDEKLSRPSFEPMNAGISFGASSFVFTSDSSDWLEVPAVEFETIILNQQSGESRPSDTTGPNNRYRLAAGVLALQARFGSAGASALRRTGEAKYRTATSGKYQVKKEGWSVIATEDMSAQTVPGVPAGAAVSYSEAEQAVRAVAQTDPKRAAGLKILRLSELAVKAG